MAALLLPQPSLRGVLVANPALALRVCLCWSLCGLAAQAARARVRRRRLTRRLGAFDACAARLVQGGGPAESTTTILCRLCAAVAGVQVLLLADFKGEPRRLHESAAACRLAPARCSLARSI